MESPLHGQPLDALMESARRGGHRLARSVVEGLARHGDAAVAAFETLLREPWPWDDDELDAWWMRLHAVMAMGLIPTERAGAVLLAFLERIGAEDDEELAEWLSGYWPALMRNKPGQVVQIWRATALNRNLDFHTRVDAVEVALALAERDGPESLEGALDWAAALAADRSDEPPMRALTALCMLDFPRERHRDLLLEVAESTAEEHMYDREEVADAFEADEDVPAWRGFSDPWKFYDPAQADLREARWAEDEAAEADEEVLEPFVRDEPKVGRNEPCPCGTGKKYKRCCGSAAT